MNSSGAAIGRLRLTLHGAVQGVGFRPFIHRLAHEFELRGWVANSSEGLVIEVEGGGPSLEEFRARVVSNKPPGSVIYSLEEQWLDAAGIEGFEIRSSCDSGPKTAFITPDLATCPDCVREIFDPADRRYRYPFTNCTHCGPRFSIILALPYDRGNTTMGGFVQCPECEAEYNDPANRRFHAQPNACPSCGPQLAFWDPSASFRQNPSGPRSDAGGDPIRQAADALRAGRIVALKGLGGFHLTVDARKSDAIHRLRMRKHREAKPLAVMFPTLDCVREYCQASSAEARLLQSPQAPIVLLKQRADAAAHALPPAVAPGNPCLGVMLPYTPLHHLLLSELDFPVVMTSGNLSDEPICTNEQEAFTRLRGIADCFLVHNRPIERHVDDSIVRVVLGRELILRRARGYAPLPISLAEDLERGPDLLGVGAHLKNTVALGMGRHVWVSQHVGDLETVAANQAFEKVIADFQRLYGAKVAEICADLHPDYYSTVHARSLANSRVGTAAPTLRKVQHHVAHVLACMAENEILPPVLGVAWDGTGYGPDGTIWGGEFFRVEPAGWRRVAHLRPFGLPGGDRAVREPRRSAFGLLYALRGEALLAEPPLPFLGGFSATEFKNLAAMLRGNLNTPETSSAGRLFDAIAALLGLVQISHFEGQAAMALEFAASSHSPLPAYPFEIHGTHPNRALSETNEALVLDWGPMILAILADLQQGIASADIASRFHSTLARMIVAVAQWIRVEKVALSGGCFQNARLLESVVQGLQVAGFKAYWHQRIPPNDGGIALGQVVAARGNFRSV